MVINRRGRTPQGGIYRSPIGAFTRASSDDVYQGTVLDSSNTLFRLAFSARPGSANSVADLHVNSDGSVFVVTGQQALYKYDSSLSLAWTASLTNYARKVTGDSSGNAYVRTGGVSGGVLNKEGFAQVNSSGTVQHETLFSTPTYSAGSTGIHTNGTHVVVATDVTSTEGRWMKYTIGGSHVWDWDVTTPGGAASFEGFDARIKGDGSIILAGRGTGWPGGSNVPKNLWHISSDSLTVNATFDAGVGSSTAVALLGVDVDSSGNVYAGGTASTTWPGSGGSTASMFKLNSSLALQSTDNSGGTIGDVHIETDSRIWAAGSGATSLSKGAIRYDTSLTRQNTVKQNVATLAVGTP